VSLLVTSIEVCLVNQEWLEFRWWSTIDQQWSQRMTPCAIPLVKSNSGSNCIANHTRCFETKTKQLSESLMLDNIHFGIFFRYDIWCVMFTLLSLYVYLKYLLKIAKIVAELMNVTNSVVTELKRSPPCLQKPVTGPNPEPNKSTRHARQPISLRSILNYSPIYASVFREIAFHRISPPKLLFPLPCVSCVPPTSSSLAWCA
jgi:hypothetical protein